MAVTIRELAPSTHRIFGVASGEFLRRQAAQLRRLDGVIVATANIAMSDAAVRWLASRKRTVLLSASGVPLIGRADGDDADALQDALAAGAVPPGFDTFVSDEVDIYAKKLRRTERLTVHELVKLAPDVVERTLFDTAYKGVTDLITAVVWPRPTWHVVRALASLGVPPNAVTMTGMLLAGAAGWLFYEASWGWGLLAAWCMSFLDTVDGKLARVTAQSSRLGDNLDHVTDQIHPPIWWACMAQGIATAATLEQTTVIWPALGVILGAYLAGRASELLFKYRFGFNQFMWRPFDSRLRLILARRNINLSFMTAGALVDCLVEAWALLAAWHVITIGAQLVRFVQAQVLTARGTPIVEWMTAGRALNEPLDASPTAVRRTAERVGTLQKG